MKWNEMNEWYGDNDSEVKMRCCARANEPENWRCKDANRLGQEWLLEEIKAWSEIELRRESEKVISRAW